MRPSSRPPSSPSRSEKRACRSLRLSLAFSRSLRRFDRFWQAIYTERELYRRSAAALAGVLNDYEGRPLASESLPRVLRRLLREHEPQHGDGASADARHGPALFRAGEKELSGNEELLQPRAR